jgi:hypothetical protein
LSICSGCNTMQRSMRYRWSTEASRGTPFRTPRSWCRLSHRRWRAHPPATRLGVPSHRLGELRQCVVQSPARIPAQIVRALMPSACLVRTIRQTLMPSTRKRSLPCLGFTLILPLVHRSETSMPR